MKRETVINSKRDSKFQAPISVTISEVTVIGQLVPRVTRQLSCWGHKHFVEASSLQNYLSIATQKNKKVFQKGAFQNFSMTDEERMTLFDLRESERRSDDVL